MRAQCAEATLDRSLWQALHVTVVQIGHEFVQLIHVAWAKLGRRFLILFDVSNGTALTMIEVGASVLQFGNSKYELIISLISYFLKIAYASTGISLS